jgi:hypothetical protein
VIDQPSECLLFLFSYIGLVFTSLSRFYLSGFIHLFCYFIEDLNIFSFFFVVQSKIFKNILFILLTFLVFV